MSNTTNQVSLKEIVNAAMYNTCGDVRLLVVAPPINITYHDVKREFDTYSTIPVECISVNNSRDRAIELPYPSIINIIFGNVDTQVKRNYLLDILNMIKGTPTTVIVWNYSLQKIPYGLAKVFNKTEVLENIPNFGLIVNEYDGRANIEPVLVVASEPLDTSAKVEPSDSDEIVTDPFEWVRSCLSIGKMNPVAGFHEFKLIMGCWLDMEIGASMTAEVRIPIRDLPKCAGKDSYGRPIDARGRLIDNKPNNSPFMDGIPDISQLTANYYNNPAYTANGEYFQVYANKHEKYMTVIKLVGKGENAKIGVRASFIVPCPDETSEVCWLVSPLQYPRNIVVIMEVSASLFNSTKFDMVDTNISPSVVLRPAK